jgi:hypothetical protein
VDVLLYQFHIAGKSGLALAEDDLELFLLCGFNHAVKVGPQAVSAGVILITVDLVDVPSVLYGIVEQHRFLVLDAFGFVLLLFLVLLTQSCINRAKYLLHLLRRHNCSLKLQHREQLSGKKSFEIHTPLKQVNGSFRKFFCEPCGDGLLDGGR